MAKNKSKQYCVTDSIYINSEPLEVAVEMWTAEQIIDTILERRKIGWYSNVSVLPNNTIHITNFILDNESEVNNE